MKILYIDGVGPFGGASRSLYEAIGGMPSGAVEPYFFATEGSALRGYYQTLAKDVVAAKAMIRFDNTAFSHYRGKRWLVAAAQSTLLPSTLAGAREARSRFGKVDLLHANESTDIIALLIARRLFQAPAVLHVRALMHRGDNRRTRWLNEQLKTMAAVIAIDENVRETLPTSLSVDVIHNSFTVRERGSSSDGLWRRIDNMRPGSLKVGFVGNLHHYKGILELVRAAKIIIDSGRDIEVVVIGGHTRGRGIQNRALAALGMLQDAGADAKLLVQQLDLGDHVHFLGPTNDIQEIYERLDVLCFATHLDAPGRPVFEAAFFGVPSIVAVRSPRPDTFQNDETGIAIPDPSPHHIAQAINRFADNRAEVKRMGANAKKLASSNFSPRANSAKLLEVYHRVLRCGGVVSKPQEVCAKGRGIDEHARSVTG